MVLDAVEDHVLQKKAVVNIEGRMIKGVNTAKPVVDTIRRRIVQGWSMSNFLVSSFDMQFLRDIRAEDKQVPVGAILAGEHEPWDIDEATLEMHLREIKDIQPETVNITLPSLSDRAAGMIRDSGAQPIGWTSREQPPTMLLDKEKLKLARRLIRNTSVIITDYPGQMRQLLGEYSRLFN